MGSKGLIMKNAYRALAGIAIAAAACDIYGANFQQVGPSKATDGLVMQTCSMFFGDTSNSTAMSNAQLGPQKRICFVGVNATVIQVTVSADAGTPNIIVAKNHAGSVSNLVSSALSTAANGGVACSNANGGSGLDGSTTCSNTIQNTSIVAGDFFETVSGSASTAKAMQVHITYRVTGP